MTVEVSVNVRNMKADERLREYANKKVGKLDRYLDILEEAQLDLTYVASARSAGDRNVAQLTVRGKAVLLRAEGDIFGGQDTGGNIPIRNNLLNGAVSCRRHYFFESLQLVISMRNDSS